MEGYTMTVNGKEHRILHHELIAGGNVLAVKFPNEDWYYINMQRVGFVKFNGKQLAADVERLKKLEAN